MIDYIKNIKGPDFLLYYSIFAFIMYLITIILVNLNSDKKSNVTKELTPEQIIVLKNENPKKELVKLYLFRLWQEQLIELIGSGDVKLNNDAIKEYKKNKNKKLGRIEENILSALEKSNNKSTVKDLQNMKEINSFIENTQEELESMNLIISEEQLNTCGWIKYCLFIFTCSFGLLKLYLGFINDKPILFLCILLIFVGALFLSISIKKSTKQARKYIDTLKEEYKIPTSASGTTESDTYMALHGNNYLTRPENILFYSYLGEAMGSDYSGYSSSSDSGSCHSSSDSSSSGGGSGCSSCSSCSSCGGGCGGCGGS